MIEPDEVEVLGEHKDHDGRPCREVAVRAGLWITMDVLVMDQKTYAMGDVVTTIEDRRLLGVTRVAVEVPGGPGDVEIEEAVLEDQELSKAIQDKYGDHLVKMLNGYDL